MPRQQAVAHSTEKGVLQLGKISLWITSPIQCVHHRHAALQHGRRIAQTDLDIQDSHAHHALMRSSCAWTTNGGVYGETVMPNNVKRCLHKWILIAVAIEAAMLEDSMTSHENALLIKLWNQISFLILCKVTSCLKVVNTPVGNRTGHRQNRMKY